MVLLLLLQTLRMHLVKWIYYCCKICRENSLMIQKRRQATFLRKGGIFFFHSNSVLNVGCRQRSIKLLKPLIWFEYIFYPTVLPLSLFGSTNIHWLCFYALSVNSFAFFWLTWTTLSQAHDNFVRSLFSVFTCDIFVFLVTSSGVISKWSLIKVVDC